MKINKIIYSMFILLFASSATCALLDKREDIVTFNTQEVIYHRPIPSLLNASPEELSAEPSLKQATADFTRKVGGPITRDIMDNFKKILTEEEYQRMRIDTKIQILNRNEFSNTPGWHCDFFSTTDEQEDRLIRTNPGLEADTRIFLLVSGEPATEFMTPRHFNIDINVPSWKQVSQQIDSIIKPSDLYRIPTATPVEMSGDELHRVTVYEGKDPTVRYFMRVYLFPKGHSQDGIYRNEAFNWETHLKVASLS